MSKGFMKKSQCKVMLLVKNARRLFIACYQYIIPCTMIILFFCVERRKFISVAFLPTINSDNKHQALPQLKTA